MSPPLPPDRKIVAIVDDDELVRAAMASLFRSLGYAAESFSDGPAFLAQDTLRFACIISDMQMPEMSGLELQAKLAVSDARLPLVFLTAYREDWARNRALIAGARGFFEKPCDLDELVTLVEIVVGAPARGA